MLYFMFFFFFINILQENENLFELQKKKCCTVFCIFLKQENCEKPLWTVWASLSASMEPDPLRCLLTPTMCVWLSGFHKHTSTSLACKIIFERLWQISYWAVWNLANNEDIGISKKKPKKNRVSWLAAEFLHLLLKFSQISTVCNIVITMREFVGIWTFSNNTRDPNNPAMRLDDRPTWDSHDWWRSLKTGRLINSRGCKVF